MKKPKKTRTIKAYAILDIKSGKIETADYFNDGGCDCCRGETRAEAVYLKRSDAAIMMFNDTYHKIVPCVITIKDSKLNTK